MRWIYLSPHLDDAVLSAGGLIYDQTQAGDSVEIWTFMCGYPPEGEFSPIADQLHQQWGFSSAEEAVRKRRLEDKNAAAILGATTRHFDFLDCVYRQGSNGEWLYSKITVPPHKEDEKLPAQIAEAISARLHPDDVLVCQLAVGSHVDHVLVRRAAELLGKSLRYDIDVPYIFYKPQELKPASAGMMDLVYSVSKAGVEFWKEAVLEYKSQISTLGKVFDTPEKVRESIQNYWSDHQGIRLFEKG
ncbi:MAG TPA: PIG-L family deacetylase [Anaerolineales bacterium]|nr:PIG-L family deacetylase [Anaerolineales bacterium]